MTSEVETRLVWPIGGAFLGAWAEAGEWCGRWDIAAARLRPWVEADEWAVFGA